MGCASALAQTTPNVMIFGIADIGVLRTTASGSLSQTQVNTDGNTSSRLGFRGKEDLGGGLSVGFWLEAAVNVDTGTGGSSSTNNKDSVNTGSLTFGRRSTIEMVAPWGEIRLGRDYTPTFSNVTVSMHPFGTNGVGNSGQMYYPVNTGGTTVRTNVRASNSIGYHLPSGLGGVYGTVMYALGEQTTPGATLDDGKYVGGRIGYRSGPWNMAAATGKAQYATGDYTQSNAGINYAIGAAKLMYLWGKNTVGISNTTMHMVGTQYKVLPQGELRFAYTTLKAANVDNDANQWAVGYVHDLSKRTALYANYSVVDNKGTGTRFVVGGAGNNVTTSGGSSTGIEFGIRHAF